MKPRTLYDKIWDDHLVDQQPDGTSLLYIDRHLVHEVTSPQAFDGLRLNGRSVRRPDLTIATEDHNVPTVDIDKPIAAKAMVERAWSRPTPTRERTVFVRGRVMGLI